MRELGVEGLTEDKRFLVVSDPSTDEQFRVPLDRTTELLAPSPEPTTPSEPLMTVTLTPRDIQARIRRGESAQQVADSAGVPVERIEGFAGPVLAEREYMVEQARKTTLRRRHVTGGGLTLGVLVDQGLAEIGASVDGTAWDAFRRDDGRWTVVVAPQDADTATFVYDVQGRYAMPGDDAAHELVGDVPLPATPDMAIADVISSPGQSRPAAETPAPVEIQDELELDVEIEETDVELTEAFELPPDIAAAEALLEAARHVPGVSSLKEARERRASAAMETSDIEDEREQREPEPDHLEDSIEHHDLAVPDDSSRPKKRPERRRVPSWDEIMFGDTQD